MSDMQINHHHCHQQVQEMDSKSLRDTMGKMGQLMESMGELLQAMGPLMEKLGEMNKMEPGKHAGKIGRELGEGLEDLGEALNAGKQMMDNFAQYESGRGGDDQVQGHHHHHTKVTIEMDDDCDGPSKHQAHKPVSSGEGDWKAGDRMTDDKATQTLAKGFESLKGSKDGCLSMEDLVHVANGESLPGKSGQKISPELQAAAQHVLENPELRKKLDTADQKQSGVIGGAKEDGLISLGDLNAATQDTKLKKGALDAMEDVRAFMPEGSMISKSDLEGIAKNGKMPGGEPAPEALQKSAQYLLDHPEALQKADTADQIQNKHQFGQLGDDIYSTKDFDTVLANQRKH